MFLVLDLTFAIFIGKRARGGTPSFQFMKT